MDRSAFEPSAASSAISAESNWILGSKTLKLLGRVEGPDHPQQLTIETVNKRSVSPTQPDRTFGDGFKHRLKIERRAANNLENLRRGGLLLKRFGKVIGSLTQFTEQPRI